MLWIDTTCGPSGRPFTTAAVMVPWRLAIGACWLTVMVSPEPLAGGVGALGSRSRKYSAAKMFEPPVAESSAVADTVTPEALLWLLSLGERLGNFVAGPPASPPSTSSELCGP
jgi:hypothetical protein